MMCLALSRAALGNRLMSSVSSNSALTMTVTSVVKHKGQVSNKAHHNVMLYGHVLHESLAFCR